jgi:hypothetical protein
VGCGGKKNKGEAFRTGGGWDEESTQCRARCGEVFLGEGKVVILLDMRPGITIVILIVESGSRAQNGSLD